MLLHKLKLTMLTLMFLVAGYRNHSPASNDEPTKAPGSRAAPGRRKAG